jgi:hypothetical protein
MSEDKRNFSELVQELFTGEYTEMNGVEVLNGYLNSYGLEFSEKDLDDYVNNTNDIIRKGILKPNIKLSHSDQQLILKEIFKMADVDMWEELPNLGLLENFRRKGKSVYADFKQVPKKLKDIVFGGRLFTSLSPELVKNWRESGKNIIRAVALSNIPSMKHVVDVPMSQGLSYRGHIYLEDGGKSMGADNDTKKVVEEILETKLAEHSEGIVSKLSEMWNSFTKKGKKEDETDPDNVKGKESKEKVISLSEVQSMLDNQAEEFKKQLNDVNLKLVQKDKEVKKLSDDNKTSVLSSKKAEAEAICKKAGMDGVPPYVINLFKPILMSEAGDQVIKFSEKVNDEVVTVEKQINKLVEELFDNYPNKANLSEMTQTFLSDEAMSEDKRIMARTTELMAQNPGMSKHQALTKAGEEVRQ